MKRHLKKIKPHHIGAMAFVGVCLTSLTTWQIFHAPKNGSLVREPAIAVNVQKYQNMSCTGFATNGKEFDAAFTNYFKPLYGQANGYDFPRNVKSLTVADLAHPGAAVTGNAPGTNASWAFFCAMGMECSCPNGYDFSKRCYADSGVYSAAGSERGWSPCKPFDKKTPYCDNSPETNKFIPNKTVAADDGCFDLSAGCQIEVDGKYKLTITDTGGAIKGRRFDLYTKVGQEPLLTNGLHHVRVINPGTCRSGS